MTAIVQFTALRWMFAEETSELSVSPAEDPSVSDWEQLIDWLNKTYKLEYNGPDEEAEALPKIDREEVMRLMREGEEYAGVEIQLGNSILTADLDNTDYMVFELESGAVKSQAELDELLLFMQGLGRVLRKEVTLNDNAHYSYPLITVSESGQKTEVASPQELDRVSAVIREGAQTPSLWQRIAGWFKKS